MQSKSPAAELIRKAVSAGAFLEAERLLDVYRRDVEASWHAATSDAQRLGIATQVDDFLEWARRATLAKRSHTQRKLILLRRESAYAPSISKNNGFHLEA
jgi:hypothetical protein